MQRRHRDPAHDRCDFTDDVLLVCPRCAGCAHLFAPPSCVGRTARLSCTDCGHASERYRHADVCRRTAVEPRVELWLQTRARERVPAPHGTSSVSPVQGASTVSMIEDGGRR